MYAARAQFFHSGLKLFHFFYFLLSIRSISTCAMFFLFLSAFGARRQQRRQRKPKTLEYSECVSADLQSNGLFKREQLFSRCCWWWYVNAAETIRSCENLCAMCMYSTEKYPFPSRIFFDLSFVSFFLLCTILLLFWCFIFMNFAA